MDWVHCLRTVVAKLTPPPTVRILNSGQWMGELNASFANALASAAAAVAPSVLWKTTTRLRGASRYAWLRTDLSARRAFR
jgi:hypothetical protein